jgi:hypothetical protein
VCLLPNQNTLKGGFLFSDVIFPIGRRACLGLFTKREQPIASKNQRISILVRKITPVQVRETNKLTISHAENFLFSAEKSRKIQTLFNKTTVPTRIQIINPFETTN